MVKLDKWGDTVKTSPQNCFITGKLPVYSRKHNIIILSKKELIIFQGLYVQAK